jgi:TDG/mug DNA glycosylase family protein
MVWSRDDLLRFTGATIPDVMGPSPRVLFVGVNPGLRSAAVGASFAHRGNRFWGALYQAGITDHVIDTSDGWREADLAHLYERGVALTTLVPQASARAAQIASGDLREGKPRLEAKVSAVAPAVVAVLGTTAFRTAFDAPRAVLGRQPQLIGGAELWVVPNPSGLNRHARLADLATAYRAAAMAAGIDVHPSVGDRVVDG